MIRCEEREFPAESVIDLVDHLHEFHPLPDLTQSSNFDCNNCEESFQTKHNLMIQRKGKHLDKVPKCIGFNEGTCNFQDTCWFIHELCINQSIPEFKCNFCDYILKMITKLMKHKKTAHKETSWG